MSDLADADSTIVDITAPSASLKPGAGIYDGYWRERALAALLALLLLAIR